MKLSYLFVISVCAFVLEPYLIKTSTVVDLVTEKAYAVLRELASPLSF
jgi:hypothetical protein